MIDELKEKVYKIIEDNISGTYLQNWQDTQVVDRLSRDDDNTIKSGEEEIENIVENIAYELDPVLDSLNNGLVSKKLIEDKLDLLITEKSFNLVDDESNMPDEMVIHIDALGDFFDDLTYEKYVNEVTKLERVIELLKENCKIPEDKIDQAFEVAGWK